MTTLLEAARAGLLAGLDRCTERCLCDPVACDDEDPFADTCVPECAVCTNGCPADPCPYAGLPEPLNYSAHRLPDCGDYDCLDGEHFEPGCPTHDAIASLPDPGPSFWVGEDGTWGCERCHEGAAGCESIAAAYRSALAHEEEMHP